MPATSDHSADQSAARTSLARGSLARLGGAIYSEGPWLLSESRIHNLAERVRTILNGSLPAAISDASAMMVDDVNQTAEPNYSRIDGVAHIPVVGIMTKYPTWYDSYCGLCPSAVVQAAIEDAVADPMVDSIQLTIDCPGGAVNGTVELAYAIRAANQIKPVVAFVSGLCCSGGYYIAAQCTRICAAPSSEIGCIGVFCVLTDSSKFWGDLGVTMTLVASGRFKGLGADGRVGQDMIEDQQRIVNGLCAQFVEDVAIGRKLDPAVVSLVADGRSWLPADALKLKLIDEICTAVVSSSSSTPPNEAEKEAAMKTADSKKPLGKHAAASSDDGSTDVKGTMQKCIDACNAARDSARAALDACNAIDGDADDDTTALAKQLATAADSASEEIGRISGKAKSIAGMDDDASTDSADDGDGDEGMDDDEPDDTASGGSDTTAGKPATIPQLKAAFPGADRAAFVLEQFSKGASLTSAKAAFSAVVSAENKKLRAENKKLREEHAGLTDGAEPVGFSEQHSDEEHDAGAAGDDEEPVDRDTQAAVALAKKEWKANKDGCRGRYVSETVYTNVRKRELGVR